MDDDAVCADLCFVTDRHSADYLGACPEPDTVPYRGPSTGCDVLTDHHVATDVRAFAYDRAHALVKEQTGPMCASGDMSTWVRNFEKTWTTSATERSL